MADHRDRFIGEHAHRVIAAAGDHRVRAGGDGSEGGAQDLVGRDGVGKPKRGGDEDAARALAHTRHIRGAADHHLDARRLGRRRLLGGLRGHLRGGPPGPFEGAQARDGLTAFNIATAEIEDARHQRFSFLA